MEIQIPSCREKQGEVDGIVEGDDVEPKEVYDRSIGEVDYDKKPQLEVSFVGINQKGKIVAE